MRITPLAISLIAASQISAHAQHELNGIWQTANCETLELNVSLDEQSNTLNIDGTFKKSPTSLLEHHVAGKIDSYRNIDSPNRGGRQFERSFNHITRVSLGIAWNTDIYMNEDNNPNMVSAFVGNHFEYVPLQGKMLRLVNFLYSTGGAPNTAPFSGISKYEDSNELSIQSGTLEFYKTESTRLCEVPGHRLPEEAPDHRLPEREEHPGEEPPYHYSRDTAFAEEQLSQFLNAGFQIWKDNQQEEKRTTLLFIDEILGNGTFSGNIVDAANGRHFHATGKVNLDTQIDQFGAASAGIALSAIESSTNQFMPQDIAMITMIGKIVLPGRSQPQMPRMVLAEIYDSGETEYRFGVRSNARPGIHTEHHLPADYGCMSDEPIYPGVGGPPPLPCQPDFTLPEPEINHFDFLAFDHSHSQEDVQQWLRGFDPRVYNTRILSRHSRH